MTWPKASAGKPGVKEWLAEAHVEHGDWLTGSRVKTSGGEGMEYILTGEVEPDGWGGTGWRYNGHMRMLVLKWV